MRPRITLLVAAALLAVAVQGWPGRSTGPRLQPGAGEGLGIANLGDAGAALLRPFDDPIVLSLDAGSGATSTPLHCQALLERAPHIVGTRPAADWNVLQRSGWRIATRCAGWLPPVRPAGRPCRRVWTRRARRGGGRRPSGPPFPGTRLMPWPAPARP